MPRDGRIRSASRSLDLVEGGWLRAAWVVGEWVRGGTPSGAGVAARGHDVAAACGGERLTAKRHNAARRSMASLPGVARSWALLFAAATWQRRAAASS